MPLEHVAHFIERHALGRTLVGVSGGADSVVLLHVLVRLGVEVVAAHVNYRLRGEASEGDEAFVRSFASSHGVPVEVVRYDTKARAAERGQSVQEAARELRYAFFEEAAAGHGCGWVAVAHHRDDQAETVLLNLLRGSGPDGLAGMPERRPLRYDGDLTLVRPLLGVRRHEVEAYARAEGLSWREDASNASLAYRRGAVREAILPLVEAHFGAAVDKIAEAADLVRAYVDHTLAPNVEARWRAAARTHGAGGSLALEVLRGEVPVWRRRLVLEAVHRWLPGVPRSRATAEAVAALVDAQPGRRVPFAAGTVWRERERLFFSPATGDDARQREQVLAPGEAVALPHGTLRLQVTRERPARLDAGAPCVQYADAERLVFPLAVRPWRAGDRFRPLGMEGSKKISDFLTDERVPPHRRADIHVVVSAGRVVGVVGHRIAEDVRVRPSTRRYAKISFLSAEDDGPSES